MQILIVAHSNLVPYGLVGRLILEQGTSLTVVRPSEGIPLPEKPDAYDGLVILGGLQNAMQDEAFPHFIPLMTLIHDFERFEKPVLGICLGAQLLARSHGARIHRMSQAERGFTLVKRTPAAKSDPLFSLTPETRYLMEWHEDTFDLPSGARLLATGDNCANQAFRIRRASYGVQFHPEATPEIIRGWIDSRPEHLKQQDPHLTDRIGAQTAQHMPDAFAYCRSFTLAWLTLAGKKH
ncbi:class I glutamine amidotransferase [delta proteobacterium NaphS2]|nr:class I glutamine amidotransferase [delta proteobacterium NaphS2]